MPVRGVRRRYIYAEIVSEDELDSSSFLSALDEKIHYLYGVTGAAAMNARLIEWSDDPQSVIVRVNHVKLEEMRAVLAHITEVGGVRARADVKRVSGTIKTLKSKI